MSLSESQPYTVAAPGAEEKKRELELYRDPDKDSSHCQVSRPGQLNTESDPSTHAHPWEREIEEGRMEKGGGRAVTRALSQGSLSLEAAGVLKMAKQNVQDKQRIIVVNCVKT